MVNRHTLNQGSTTLISTLVCLGGLTHPKRVKPTDIWNEVTPLQLLCEGRKSLSSQPRRNSLFNPKRLQRRKI